MKHCKKHPFDLSSSVGVCASCLRERLFSLIAAQSQSAHRRSQLSRPSASLVDDHTLNPKSDSHPPPLIFPRSVSPYVTRRKSDDDISSSHPPHLLFYSTPQVGPTFNSSSTATFPNSRSFPHKKPTGSFSLFSRLFSFRSRSNKLNPVPSRDSTQPSTSSPASWFSTIVPSRRKNQSKLFSLHHSGAAACRHRGTTDRGMSPVRGADSDGDCDRSPSGSNCSSDSPEGWKKTPACPPTARRGKAGNSRNVSGMAFCLSPLVRASPNHHRTHKGGLPPDMGLSGEVRIPGKPHMSTTALFCKNRSRKLADFGRANHNR